jgi:DNA-binding helix-hairpin-helix protein with protein kinase domain
MMNFLGLKAPAVAPALLIPEESALIQALRTAYRNPAITTTKAMHLDVSARHPNWTVNLKRIRKLLCKVVAQHEHEQTGGDCGEAEVEDWCVITAPGIAAPAAVSKAASVSALWAARRRDATPHPAPPALRHLKHSRLRSDSRVHPQTPRGRMSLSFLLQSARGRGRVLALTRAAPPPIHWLECAVERTRLDAHHGSTLATCEAECDIVV